MHKVDLFTIKEIFTENTDLCVHYCDAHNIRFQSHELEDLCSLLDNFDQNERYKFFKNFTVGYKIMQIGKEFDLLKMDESFIINIEIKKQNNEESIIKQCQRNYYYFRMLSQDIHIFTYVSEENTLYRYTTNDNQLKKVSFSEMKDLLNELSDETIDLDKVFIPNNYLVSPFNTPEKFLENSYFLTNHQEQIKNEIVNSDSKIYIIEGGPGTGKTLLTYDIAKFYIKHSKDVRIIHCGNLNSGQFLLQKRFYKIYRIKDYSEALKELSEDTIIFVDEAQRLRYYQFDEILNSVNEYNCKIVFSLDQRQVLHNEEVETNIREKLTKYAQEDSFFKLSNKIRTNPKLADFIQFLLYKRHIASYKNDDTVRYTFLRDIDSVEPLVKELSKEGWMIINPTPSQYFKEVHDEYHIAGFPVTHEVVGQEFEKVALIVPETYFYNEKGQLYFSSKSYYRADKMFYQAITRTRSKLYLIIVRNVEVLCRVIEYFDTDSKFNSTTDTI